MVKMRALSGRTAILSILVVVVVVAACGNTSSPSATNDGSQKSSADRDVPSDSSSPSERLPTSIRMPDDPCDAFDVDAAKNFLEEPTETTSAGPAELGPGTYMCMVKVAAGDDQAPGVLMIVTEGTSPQKQLKAYKDHSAMMGNDCSYGTSGQFQTRTCTEGGGSFHDAGDTIKSYNFWFFAGDTAVSCGLGLAEEFDLSTAEEVCRNQFAQLS